MKTKKKHYNPEKRNLLIKYVAKSALSDKVKTFRKCWLFNEVLTWINKYTWNVSRTINIFSIKIINARLLIKIEKMLTAIAYDFKQKTWIFAK